MMTVVWWVLGGAVVAGFVWIVARLVRSEGKSPGLPTSVMTGTHDEPLEDTAKPIDAEHHHTTAGEQTAEYSDIRRPFVGR